MKFILCFLIIFAPFVVASDKNENASSTNQKYEDVSKEDGYGEKGYVRKGVDRNRNTYDDMMSKREKRLEKMKNRKDNLPQKSITNKIANNLNEDISIDYFNPSEQSVVFNTYIDKDSVGFEIGEKETPKMILRSSGVKKVNNMKASQIDIKELFIGVNQGKIKKIIIENAIGERQEYYDLEFHNVDNVHFQISGNYGKRGTMSLFVSERSESVEGKFTSTNLKHNFNYMIFNKEGKGYIYDIYKKN